MRKSSEKKVVIKKGILGSASGYFSGMTVTKKNIIYYKSNKKK